MHLQARADATGRPVHVRHLAEVLAAGLPEPRARMRAGRRTHRRCRVSGQHLLPGTSLRQRTAAAVADERLRTQRRAAPSTASPSHRAEGLAELEDADGLRRAARAVEAAGPGRPAGAARAVRRPGRWPTGGHVCWAPTAADARRYVVDVVRRRGRHAGGEVEVDGHRGDRPQRGARGRRRRGGRDRPRRVDHPAGRRDAEPHHRPGPAPGPPLDQGPVRRHGRRAADARHRADRAGRASPGSGCARCSSPPTSASPAPTSAVAETGSIVLVTNEGNGRLVTVAAPRPHRRARHGAAGRRLGTRPTCCSRC